MENSTLSDKRNTTSENMQRSLEKREYVAHWVRFLENFLGLKLAKDQVDTWIRSLYQYDPWKLDQLVNFRLNEEGRGRTLADVCRFLDALMPHPERESVREDLGYKQIPEEAESLQEYRANVAKDLSAHIKSFTLNFPDFHPSERKLKERNPEQFEKELGEWKDRKLQVEKNGYEKLHKQYPHSGFDSVLEHPRFDKIRV